MELEDAKLDNDPPETLISLEAKLEVASLEVNVKAIELSFEVSPSETVDDVIVMVGAVVSQAASNLHSGTIEKDVPPVISS